MVELYGDALGYAGLLHGYAVKNIGNGHSALGVGNDNELAIGKELLNQGVETVVVGFVQGGIDLVEEDERRGLGLEDAQ